MVINSTDTRILTDTYRQIDQVQAGIEQLREQLDSATVPFFRAQIRELIKQRQARIKTLENQARAILTMIE